MYADHIAAWRTILALVSWWQRRAVAMTYGIRPADAGGCSGRPKSPKWVEVTMGKKMKTYR